MSSLVTLSKRRMSGKVALSPAVTVIVALRLPGGKVILRRPFDNASFAAPSSKDAELTLKPGSRPSKDTRTGAGLVALSSMVRFFDVPASNASVEVLTVTVPR
jgi:hypothetical protein